MSQDDNFENDDNRTASVFEATPSTESGGDDSPSGATLDDHVSITRRMLKTFWNNKLQLISVLVILGIVLLAVFAPFLAPHDPDSSYDLLQEPNSYSEGDFNNDGEMQEVHHVMGTDSFGHDVLSRIIYGARISLLVAFVTVALAFLIGVTIGLVAGFYGGWVDNALMRYIDFQWAFPEIVLAIVIIAFMGGLGVMNVIIAISLAYLDDFARVVRGEVLWIREQEYVKAARTIGMSDIRIMRKEILPNAVAPIIVQATVLLPLAILWEAALSFLGLGVSPATPTWGLLISEGRGYITTAWWITIMPGLMIMLTALAFNIVGDGLRDAFDVTEDGKKQ